jgi:hypothetical protein
VVASDHVKTKDDSHSKANQEERKEAFLSYHDHKTAGIPGLLPLVLDLPVRFTQAPDRGAKAKGVFTNARGCLRGWELPPEGEERIAGMDDPEIVLKQRPLYLYIEVEGGSKDLQLLDGQRVYKLRPQYRMWTVDEAGKLKVQRAGFPIVPDFGGTAHAYCGTSLDASLGDLLEWWHKPRRGDAIRGYIVKSRIRKAKNLLLAQPYSPHLFRQGPPLGPYYLRKVLAREENENGERMTKAVALRAWRQKDKQLEAEKENNDASDKLEAIQATGYP